MGVTSTPAVVVRNLSKDYGDYLAVNNACAMAGEVLFPLTGMTGWIQSLPPSFRSPIWPTPCGKTWE